MTLRILHVTDSSAGSGAEWNLLTLLRNAPPDVENQTAFLFDQGDLHGEFARQGRVHTIGNGRRSGYPRALRQLRALLDQERIDLIHTQLLASTFLGRLSALGRPVGVLTTLQSAFYDGEDFGRFTPVTREAYRLVDRATARRNDALIAVSDYVREHFVERIGFERSRVEVIYNCLEPSRAERPPEAEIARARAAVGLAPGDAALLAVGRLMSQKGQDDAIRAMPQILRDVPQARLLLVGDGPERGAFEELARSLDLGAKVIFAGIRRDVPALLHGSRLFVFPSRREGLSVALVEALAAGLPAVVCGIPQNREVGEGIGSVRFIPPQDPAALAREAAALLLDPNIPVVAREAAAGVVERFHPRRLAGRFFELCRRHAPGGAAGAMDARSRPV